VRNIRRELMGKLVIDGNCVYEIDEECIRRKENQEKGQREMDKRRGRPASSEKESYRRNWMGF
jgi:hypothetical protein